MSLKVPGGQIVQLPLFSPVYPTRHLQSLGMDEPVFKVKELFGQAMQTDALDAITSCEYVLGGQGMQNSSSLEEKCPTEHGWQ